MSYILDALRKAEAERRMGAASDAPAAPRFEAASADARSGGRNRRWLWVMLAAAAGALVALGWIEWRTNTTPPARSAPVASIPPAANASALPAAPSLPPASSPTPTVAEPAAPVALHRPPAPIEPPAAPARSARAAGTPRDAATIAAARQATSERSPQQPAGATATLRELPAAIRQQIPPLAVSGYIYAPAAADRSVLINQKLLREGDEVAAGLTLETLMPKGMVLNYKGYRFRVGY
jgi:general secretion pathway protein B